MSRSKYIIFSLSILALFVLVLNSCNLAYMTQEQRLAQFESDLNNDSGRDVIYKNLHPTIADAWKMPAVWTGNFNIDDAPYNFSNEVYNGSSVSGEWSCGLFSKLDFVCEMAEYGTEGWYITKFYSNNTQLIPKP